MSKFTFTYNFVPEQLDRSNIASKTTVEFEADTLDEVLGQFTQFLRGAGFYFDGDVEIVDNSSPLTDIETKDIPVPANLEVKEKMNHKELHDELMHVVVRLPSDYYPFGDINRWQDEDKGYPDCSMGCKFFKTLSGQLGADWGVCVNRKSKRFGFLTFEHQAGYDCFESNNQ